MSTEPWSRAGLEFGQRHCERSLLAEFACNLDDANPRPALYTDKVIARVAVVCWMHRVPPELVVKALAENATKRFSGIFYPDDVLARADKTARDIAEARQDGHESLAVTGQLQAVKTRIEVLQSFGMAEDDAFRQCMKELVASPDILYCLAMRSGLGVEASKLLPAAVWFLRIYPSREKVLQEFMAGAAV